MAATAVRRPVIRLTVEVGSSRVRTDPWAVDDYAGDRWILEARRGRRLGGGLVEWRLEKRGEEIVACSRLRATAQEVRERFGPEAAARFFPEDDGPREIDVEMPIPVGLGPPAETRSRLRAQPAARPEALPPAPPASTAPR